MGNAKIKHPSEEDWDDMSGEWGYRDNIFRWKSPLGGYIVGKRIDADNNEKWYYSGNSFYCYSQNGKEFNTKEEAMDAAFSDFLELLEPWITFNEE